MRSADLGRNASLWSATRVAGALKSAGLLRSTPRPPKGDMVAGAIRTKLQGSRYWPTKNVLLPHQLLSSMSHLHSCVGEVSDGEAEEQSGANTRAGGLQSRGGQHKACRRV